MAAGECHDLTFYNWLTNQSPKRLDRTMSGRMPTNEDIGEKLDTLLRGQSQQWPRFLSVQRAGEYTSLSDVSIRRLISSGKLTALRPCRGRVLLDRHQLDALVTSATTVPRTGRGMRAGNEAG